MRNLLIILAAVIAVSGTANAAKTDVVCEGTTGRGASLELLMSYDGERGNVTIRGASGEVILGNTLVSVQRDDSTFLPVLYVQNFDWEPRLNITLTMTAHESVGEAVLIRDGQEEVAQIKCDLHY